MDYGTRHHTSPSEETPLGRIMPISLELFLKSLKSVEKPSSVHDQVEKAAESLEMCKNLHSNDYKQTATATTLRTSYKKKSFVMPLSLKKKKCQVSFTETLAGRNTVWPEIFYF